MLGTCLQCMGCRQSHFLLANIRDRDPSIAPNRRGSHRSNTRSGETARIHPWNPRRGPLLPAEPCATNVPGVASAGHANRKSTGGREHPAALLDCLLWQEFQIAQDLRSRIGKTLKRLCLSQKAVVVSPGRPVLSAFPRFSPIDGLLCEVNPIAPVHTAEPAI